MNHHYESAAKQKLPFKIMSITLEFCQNMAVKKDDANNNNKAWYIYVSILLTKNQNKIYILLFIFKETQYYGL